MILNLEIADIFFIVAAIVATVEFARTKALIALVLLFASVGLIFV